MFIFKVQISGNQMWTPCSPGAPGAVETKWSLINPSSIWEGPATAADAQMALARTPRSVDPDGEDMKKMLQFTNKLGSSDGL